MKRKIFYAFIALIFMISLTGCGKKATEGETFTIICTTEKDITVGFEHQNVTTYNFNKDQYVTDYSVETTQKFDKKDVYNEYKSAQEVTVKDTSDENITYDLKSDDKNMTLIFTMKVKNIDINKAESEEEKNNLKASSILKSNEEHNVSCVVKGIDKDKIK